MLLASRRLLVVGFAAMLTSLFGLAAPASADHTLVSFRDECLGVVVSWTEDEPVLGHAEAIVRRNGTEIDRLHLTGNRSTAYLAADGDVFEIQDGRTRSHTYDAPAGCTGSLTITALDECFSTQLNFRYTGTSTLTGLRLMVEGGPPAGQALPEITAAGSIDFSVAVADGMRYTVMWPVPGTSTSMILFNGVRTAIAGCSLENVGVTFVDQCDGTKVTMHNRAGGTVRLEISVRDVVLLAVTVLAGETASRTVAASPGDLVKVREYVGVGAEVARHTVVGTPTCASPSASVPVTSPSAGPGLPVTGTAITLVAGVGGLLVLGGAAFFVLARRRRMPTISD